MAHDLLYGVVADLAERIELREPIVEFGSMQVEDGQPNDLRPLFHGLSFIGTDMRAGPGVDRIEDLRARCVLPTGRSARRCAWTRSSTAPIRWPPPVSFTGW